MLKLGIWQIVELITVLISVRGSYLKDGQTYMTFEAYQLFRVAGPLGRIITYLVTLAVTLLLGPLVAYKGGCQGVWFMVYCTMSLGLLVWALWILESGYCLKVKHSFWRTLLTMATYNVFLYLGGFWTM